MDRLNKSEIKTDVMSLLLGVLLSRTLVILSYLFLIISISLILIGCSTNTVVTREVPVEVLIPTYKTPEFPYRDLPKLPLDKLTAKSSDKDVVVRYAETIEILMNEILIYRSMIYPK